MPLSSSRDSRDRCRALTEFLPVSSSAHLILARAFFGFDGDKFGLPFDVACHVGTLIAVLFYFRDDVHADGRGAAGSVSTRWRASESSWPGLIWLLVVGTIPAVVVGLLFNKLIEERLRTARSRRGRAGHRRRFVSSSPSAPAATGAATRR